MRKITDSYIESHLKSAFRSLYPGGEGETLWETPVERAKGDEWYLEGTVRKRRLLPARLVPLAAACFLVCLLSLSLVDSRPEATIYLDADAGITLRINRKDKVLLAEETNPQGQEILADVDIKNMELTQALDAALDALNRRGYLSKQQSTILLSVESSNAQKAETLRRTLSEQISTSLFSLLGAATVYDQSINTDRELTELAEKFGITPGRVFLLRQLAAAHPELRFETLAGLSMSELIRYLNQRGVDLTEYAGHTGKEITETTTAREGYGIQETRQPTEDTPKESPEKPSRDSSGKKDSTFAENDPDDDPEDDRDDDDRDDDDRDDDKDDRDEDDGGKDGKDDRDGGDDKDDDKNDRDDDGDDKDDRKDEDGDDGKDDRKDDRDDGDSDDGKNDPDDDDSGDKDDPDEDEDSDNGKDDRDEDEDSDDGKNDPDEDDDDSGKDDPDDDDSGGEDDPDDDEDSDNSKDDRDDDEDSDDGKDDPDNDDSGGEDDPDDDDSGGEDDPDNDEDGDS